MNAVVEHAQAVSDARLLVSKGMSANKAAIQVGEKYGVSGRSVQSWAQKAGTPLGDAAHEAAANARACARVERLARIEETMAILARGLPDLARKALSSETGRDADGFMRATRGGLEMMRLVEGEATSRIEHLSIDEFAAEIARLAAEMDVLPG